MKNSKMQDLCTIDIIIVDYNSGNLINNCIKSIDQHTTNTSRINKIVIVNNGAPLDKKKIQKKNEPEITIINNPDNRGFAFACNQGAKICNSEYLLFLNPDTEIKDNALDAPSNLLTLPQNENIGIVGIQLIDEEGKISKTCSYRVRPMHFLSKILGIDRLIKNRYTSTRMWDWDHNQSCVVDGVMGAFFFVRRRVFEKLQGFDESFFVYYEETDFGLRAKKSGFNSYYLSTAQAYHKGGGVSEKYKPERVFYSNLSRIKYAFKHFDTASAIAISLLTLLIEPITRVLHSVITANPKDIKNTIISYRMLWSSTITHLIKK